MYAPRTRSIMTRDNLFHLNQNVTP